jgi:demethylmenaquinone methyltransferase/2-methoxy-6-polyprenyl-1,4-benzoquinol methylase
MCCGTGRQLEMLNGADMDLIGVDISQAMINESGENSKIHYINMDIKDIALPNESFDAVIVTFSLHEKEEIERNILFEKSWNLVRPGGHLVIGDYGQVPSTLKGIIWGKIAFPLIERVAGRNHYRNYISWMRKGALETQIESIAGRKNLISQHFSGTVTVCSIEKEPIAARVFHALKISADGEEP